MHEPEPEDRPRERTAPALLTVLLLLGAPAAGAALGLLVLVTAVLPNVPLGDVQRIVELGRHLNGKPAGALRLVFLGDSIVRDGIDAERVEQAAPGGWSVENLALSGGGLNEQRVLLARLLTARPRGVALGLHPGSICDLGRVGADKGYAYAYAGFVTAWPAGSRFADFPGMTPTTWEALESTRLAQWLHFRTVPANWFDNRLRTAVRSDLRAGHEADWIRPFTRSGSIAGARLERHLAGIREGYAACETADWAPGGLAARRLAGEIRAAGALPVLLLLPVHPALSQTAAPLLPELRALSKRAAEESGGILIDATGLLAAGDFADAVHPGESGRALLSDAAGRALPTPDGS